jgi:drug/metabolite transporter (DMT)-like permease
MLLGSACFAVMGALTSHLGESMTWPVLALARAALPLIFVVVLALSAGVRLVLLRAPRILWLRSIAGSISLLSTFYALPRLPIAEVYTLTNMFPIWVALISWRLMRQAPPWHLWLGIASAIAGVVLIQQDPSHGDVWNSAVLVALGASVWTAVAMLGLNRLQGIDPRAIVVHFSAVSLLFALGCWLLVSDDRPLAGALPGVDVLWRLLAIGLTATVGQLCLTRAFVKGSAPKVSVVGLSQVVFAAFLGWTVLHQSVRLLAVAGMVLVIAPSAWIILHRDQSPTVEEAKSNGKAIHP